MTNYHYASVSKALEELKSKGYTIDYNLHEEKIRENPYNYEICEIYRYEGNTNPDDEAIVFGIQSLKGEKGVFVSGFAANSENDVAKILHQLTMKN